MGRRGLLETGNQKLFFERKRPRHWPQPQIHRPHLHDQDCPRQLLRPKNVRGPGLQRSPRNHGWLHRLHSREHQPARGHDPDLESGSETQLHWEAKSSLATSAVLYRSALLPKRGEWRPCVMNESLDEIIIVLAEVRSWCCSELGQLYESVCLTCSVLRDKDGFAIQIVKFHVFTQAQSL